jgi:hypothetical protein
MTNALLAAYFGVEELSKYSLTGVGSNKKCEAIKPALDSERVAIITGWFCFN